MSDYNFSDEWAKTCRECPLCKPGIVFINGILACSIGSLIPEGYDIEAWEKENKI